MSATLAWLRDRTRAEGARLADLNVLLAAGHVRRGLDNQGAIREAERQLLMGSWPTPYFDSGVGKPPSRIR